MADVVTIEDLCFRASEIEGFYDLEPVRHKLGFSITHSDFINKPDLSVILGDDEKIKLKEINKAEESLNPTACIDVSRETRVYPTTGLPRNVFTNKTSHVPRKAFLDSKPIEKIECVDNPNVFHASTDRFECPVCKLIMPDFEYYRLHSFGRVHTQRLRRLAIRERKVTFSSNWDKLLQILYEAQIQLNFVNFEFWSMPERRFMLRMSIGDYKFQTTGFSIKDMRTKVIEKAVDFATANLSLHGGFRLVRYPYIPSIERPPVVIDTLLTHKIREVPKPSNDDPSIALEVIVMSCIDYIGCTVAKEERARYCKHIKDIAYKYLLTTSVSYCDLCDNRISNDLCESHVCSRRHFDQSFHLMPLRTCIEESLVRGIPVEEIEHYQELNESFKQLERCYIAPFELCDLQKRFCPYFCGFCKAGVRHPADLEKHVRLSSHIRNMLTRDASSDEHDKNRQIVKEHIRNLLIPSEHKQVTSVDLLPDAVREKLPLNLYTDDLIEKSIESALEDPEAHVKRCIARFENKPATNANNVGNKKRKRVNPGPRSRGVQGAIKRFRENAGAVLAGSAAMPNPVPYDRNASAKLRSSYCSYGPSTRASMAALTSSSENSLEPRRLMAAEELRRRRNFSRLLTDESSIYGGNMSPSANMSSVSRSYQHFGTPMPGSGRYGSSVYDTYEDDDLGRPSITDRLRTSAGHYENDVAGARSRSGSGFNIGGQWSSPGAVPSSPYYEYPQYQHWGSGPRDDLMSGQYMTPDYTSSSRHMGQYPPPGSDRRYSHSTMGGASGYYRY